MKTLVIPSSLNINNLPCDGVIIGIENLSVNLPFYFKLEDLRQIKKEIFVCLNKNMHNTDLDYLKDTLIELNNYNIKGVIFYDIAVVNICKSIDINYELVWSQEHMTNNYYTINFWASNKVNYTWVSNDITLREMQEIRENTNSKLMVTLFGYLPMFTSRRNLVKNYIKTFDLQDSSDINYIYKENNMYPIVDSKLGTTCYSDFVLNGLKEKLLLNYDYIILNSFLVDDTDFLTVLNLFNKVNSDNVDEFESKINSMFKTSKGFFYKETVYKVK